MQQPIARANTLTTLTHCDGGTEAPDPGQTGVDPVSSVTIEGGMTGQSGAESWRAGFGQFEQEKDWPPLDGGHNNSQSSIGRNIKYNFLMFSSILSISNDLSWQIAVSQIAEIGGYSPNSFASRSHTGGRVSHPLSGDIRVWSIGSVNI